MTLPASRGKGGFRATRLSLNRDAEIPADLDIRPVDGSPITPGPRGPPSVWVENGGWYLFYERNDAALWLAKSSDLKTWTHVQDEPVLKCGPDAYDTNSPSTPRIRM